MIEGWADELVILTPTALAETTVERLRRFALGNDLRMGMVESLAVCSLQGANAAEGLAAFELSEPGQSWLATSRHPEEEMIGLCMPNDPRGFWVIAPAERIEQVLEISNNVVSEDEIEAMRIIQGLPRLGVEWSSRLHPLNANLSEFDGVSFDKGCYVGQEVTSRMHWRGGISKKLYKVTFDSCDGIDALPCPLFSAAGSKATKLGEMCSAAFDHEGMGHGIALLPIEVAEAGRALFFSTGASVSIGEACHA